MQLYLSSYHLGNNSNQLSTLVKRDKRVGIVGNALDFSDDRARVAQSLQRETDEIKNLGLTPELLDLKDYFNKPAELQAKISELDMLWVIGGNTFILRRAMAESGLDEIIKKYVSTKSRPDFMYAGYSAGVCVLPATLKGIELADDPDFIPRGYQQQTIWEGLDILAYYVAPHYRSDHEESEMTEKTVEYYIEQKMLFKVLRDGEDLIETI